MGLSNVHFYLNVTISLTEPYCKILDYTFVFRFPIVDGRLPFDPMKISCWKKNIRNDYLSFNFQNILIMWKSCINVIIDELDGFYCVRTYFCNSYI